MNGYSLKVCSYFESRPRIVWVKRTRVKGIFIDLLKTETVNKHDLHFNRENYSIQKFICKPSYLQPSLKYEKITNNSNLKNVAPGFEPMTNLTQWPTGILIVDEEKHHISLCDAMVLGLNTFRAESMNPLLWNEHGLPTSRLAIHFRS